MSIPSAGIYVLIAFAAFSVLRVALLPKRDRPVVNEIDVVATVVSEPVDGR